MNHGEWTARTARVLADHLQSSKCEVLFDHGLVESDPADKLGKIASWIGTSYGYEAILGHLDIAVVMPTSNRVIALIEIEESGDNPKTLLGDIFGALLGAHLTFQGTRQLDAGEWTTLLVMAQSAHLGHQGRLTYLQSIALELRTHSRAANSRIGHVTLDSFTNELELQAKVRQYVDTAIEQSLKYAGAVSQ